MTATVSSKRAQTQDRLMDAATALFAEKGVLAASVEEICERAGFTRGAFYSNFESKDELMLAVFKRQSGAILKAATDAIASVPPTRIEPRTVDEVIRQALQIFQAAHSTDDQWLLACSEIRLHALRNPDVRVAINQIDDDLDALMAQAIQSVIDQHGLVLKIAPDQLISLLGAYQQELAFDALREGKPSSAADSAEPLATLVRALIEIP